jgi:16S rRNA processing protein RimM
VDKQTDWVILGRFGKPHGIKGFISIHAFTDPRENLLDYKELYAPFDKEWRVIELYSFEVHPKIIIAKVQGFADRTAVEALTNKDIAAPKDALPALEPGEYYWHQLIGMQVTNQQGLPLGKVTEILATGSNDVLVVEGERQHLIPYVMGSCIQEVNKQKQCIIVDWDADF